MSAVRSRVGNLSEYAARAEAYAQSVRTGTRAASVWEQAAIARQDRDLGSSSLSATYVFDAGAADRVCHFVSMLPHVKGKWAVGGALVTLEGWQCWFLRTLYGWQRRDNGKRRFRKASLYVPRKNGKSLLAAAIGLYMFAADGETGVEVYSGATSEKQAWEVFKPARQMAVKLHELQSVFSVTVHARSMSKLDGGKFEPVIGKPGDGASPHCAIVDEYHEHDTSSMYDTMLTGMGAREQPLLLVVTTAGDNLGGPCYDDWQTCQHILQQLQVVDDHLALIYTIDAEDDWTTEEALVKANPNIDVSVFREFLLARQRDAVTNTRRQGIFQTKHLNCWINARAQYINITKWMNNAVKGLTWGLMRGRKCYVGVDLASKVDIASVVYLFPPATDGAHWAVLARNYLPEACVMEPGNEHYRGWHAAGQLVATDGNIIDFARILADLTDGTDGVEICEVGYDPHQATMLVTSLMEAGLSCVEVRQSVANLSEPMKMIDALVRDSALDHDGDPVNTWMVSNVTAYTNAKDEVYPRKDRPENKIDFFVALCIAMARAMVGKDGSECGIDDFLTDPIWI